MRAGPVFLLVLCTAAGRQGAAQSSYYNLDAGRPGRVEDAEPTPLYSLDLDPSSLQYERLRGGTSRFRAEPRIAYGALPFTEIELRIPIIAVDPPRALGARLTTGLGGVGVGFLHAFNVETSNPSGRRSSPRRRLIATIRPESSASTIGGRWVG
jgi:hypothetical protein